MMNKRVNLITFAVIGILIMMGASMYAMQYEWVLGTIALPNRELAFADTEIELIYKDLVTQKEFSQSFILRKGKNVVNYSILIPESKNQFTLTYWIDGNKRDSIMNFAYHSAGALNQQLKSVVLQDRQPITVDLIKGKMLHIQLLENKAVWDRGDMVVASLQADGSQRFRTHLRLR